MHVNPAYLKMLSDRDFAAFGATDLAYVKETMVDGRRIWGIFSANGAQVGSAPNRDLAFAAVRQHDLEPMSVH